jgi:hypothetical protein
MTPDVNDPRLHQQMGEVLAEIRNIRDTLRQSEIKSDANRTTMHQRMDQLVDRVGKVEGNLAVVQEDVKEMKPTIDEVKAWRNRGIGGLFIVGVGASALSFLLSTYFTSIIAWMTKAGP